MGDYKDYKCSNQNDDGIFNCFACDVICSDILKLESHVLTDNHKGLHKDYKFCSNVGENGFNPDKLLCCNLCNYSCQHLNVMRRHISSSKHENNYKSSQLSASYRCKCNKTYKHRQGLWKHKQICTMSSKSNINDNGNAAINEVISSNVVNNSATSNPNVNVITPDMLSAFMTIMQQNQEFKELMLEQSQEQQKHNQEIQNQLLELAKEGRNTIINNHTNNSFNLNVYLNETCKDAMNMLDYVNSLQLELSDLEETGKLGYTNGMSRIFINGLKDMDIHKRPIHCSDLKREVLYIKEDNVWEKDNENRDKLKGALRMIEKKNIMLIPVWVKAHPNCVISSNRENTPYLKMVMNSTGGENPEETADMAKIITNIAKAVVINK